MKLTNVHVNFQETENRLMSPCCDTIPINLWRKALPLLLQLNMERMGKMRRLPETAIFFYDESFTI